MPRIFTKQYTKNLASPDAPKFRLELVRSFFLSTPVGNYYRLDESSVTGAVYSHILELKKFEGIPEWLIDYSQEDLDIDLYPDAESQVEHLQELYGEPFIIKTIGRFAYNNMQICKNGEEVDAKQIFGAYIDPEYANEGLGFEVYSLLIEEYGCLVSDDTQSIAGSSFWAQRLSVEFDVFTYDTVQRKVLEQFKLENDKFIYSIKPWSLEEPIDIKAISKIEHIPYSTEDKSHIVLFTQG
ncbi:hypothetical protein QNE49_003856 [Vibrio fluvialis]|nr:hypothetical protein [Vibrio fluvialis]